MRYEMSQTYELTDDEGQRVSTFEVRHDAITRVTHAADANGERYELRHFNGMLMTISFSPAS